MKIVCLVINNPKLYAPGREFVREADLDVMTPGSGYCEECHVHLLSDAIIVSSRVTGMTGMFKFKQALDLSVARLEGVDPAISVNSFALSVSPEHSSSDNDIDLQLIFRCRGAEDLTEWMELIEKQQEALQIAAIEARAAKRNRRGSVALMAKRSSQHYRRASSAGANESESGSEQQGSSEVFSAGTRGKEASSAPPDDIPERIDVEQLLQTSLPEGQGGRGVRTVLEFLRREVMLERDLGHLHQVAIEPLVDAARGAELVVGLTEAEREQQREKEIGGSPTARRSSAAEIFMRRGSYTDVIGGMSSRMQMQSVQEALADADAQIYFRSVENVVASLSEFLMLLEMSVSECHLDEGALAVGALCTSPQAQSLYQQLRSYASGYQAALRVLDSPVIVSFKTKVEDKLRSLLVTGTMTDLVLSVLDFPKRLHRCLVGVLGYTTEAISDRAEVSRALTRLEEAMDSMDRVVAEKKNFEKLISVRDGFVSTFLGGQDPVLTGLVSNERRFIREGDLTKVCRRTDKVFRFWLFSDYLVYGQRIAGGMYKWNRAIDMSVCRVKSRGDNGSDESRSFEIYGAEKSFVVLAANREDRERWVRDLEGVGELVRRRRGESGEVAGRDEPQEVAPLWVPDSVGGACCVCNTVIIASKDIL